MRASSAALLASLLGLCSPANAGEQRPPDAEENLPAVGRSLFDEIVHVRDAAGVRFEVPYPFPELVSLIEQRGGLSDTALRRVLIPLGRSLQRNGASPEFFRSPRAVLTVVGEPAERARAGTLALKDRLFIGYQERVQSMEVISYNEQAGRFEFQLVKDYGPGLRPRVVYTRRSTCTLCHQNEAPIFARTPWDETNANPLVAALLRRERSSFHGIPAAATLDEPNAIDDATDRASLLTTYQRLWREGCGAAPDASRCRATLWLALVQLRLSGSRPPSQAAPALALPWRELGAIWRAAWSSAWPEGLAIPDPNLPNRDPLHGPRPSSGRTAVYDDFGGAPTLDRAALMSASAVDPLFEPFLRRAPLEIWRAQDLGDARLEQILTGMAGWIARADLRELDRGLFERAAPSARYRSPCTLERRERAGGEALLALRCSAPDGTSLEGSVGERSLRGSVERLQLPGRGRLWNLAIGERSRRTGPRALELALTEPGSALHARLADGDAIARIELGWKAPPGAEGPLEGEAVVHVLGDFAAVRAAVERLRERGAEALGPTPFRPALLMSALLEELGLRPATSAPGLTTLPAAEFADP